jgi:hypothetical protein
MQDVAQGVVGEVEDVIRLMIGHMDQEQVEPYRRQQRGIQSASRR